jgi:hypothetical protein
MFYWVGNTGMAMRHRYLMHLLEDLALDGFTVTRERDGSYVAKCDNEIRRFDVAGTSVPRSALI